MLTPDDPPGPGATASGQKSVAVGGDVHDSTIITGDSNVIYLGGRSVPRRLPRRRMLLGLVVVVAGAVAAFVYYPRPTPPIPTMNGDLNVAVAEFGTLDAQGAAVGSPEGRSLADALYGTLGAELEPINQAAASSDQAYRIQLWGPAQIGRILGSTGEVRATEAERVATRGKVDLLVYGYLEQRPDAITFVPQFILRNLQAAPELEGEHDLGRSVAVRSLDDPSSRQQLHADVNGQTHAFAAFVTGLSEFTSDKFTDANVHFTQAANDPRWRDGPGKETLFLFLGYTEGSLNNLSAARANFQRALAINPEFARAYLALGEVTFQESLGKPDACAREAINTAGIQEAIQTYQRALAAKTQPARSNVPDWTALEMGRAYLCLSQAETGNYWPDAEREFNIVIADYNAGNASAKDISAEAHSNLGFVYLPLRCDPERDAKYRKAAAEYQTAVDLSPFHPTRLGFYYQMLGFIQTRLGALDEARAAYRNAANADPARKSQYDQLLQNVQPPVAETCP